MKAYELEHIVGFEETNLLGNVYFVHPIRWQGQCREMFLREHAPSVLAEIDRGLVLATTQCSCEYLKELRAFDEIVIRMRLAEAVQNRLTMAFEYVRKIPGGEERVARGEQQVAFLRRTADGVAPAPIPEALLEALKAYA